METIITQLTDIYLSPAEWWHENRLSREESNEYHRRMIEKGNIIYIVSPIHNHLLGYCEFLRVNFEQFGRMVCHAPFYSYDEDTTSGNICIVHNVWIHPEYRKSFVVKELRQKFFEKNKHCEYFGGFALRKKTQPIKIFKRELLEKLVNRMSLHMEGVI